MKEDRIIKLLKQAATDDNLDGCGILAVAGHADEIYDSAQECADGYSARVFWQVPAEWRPRDFAHFIAMLAMEIAGKEFLTPGEMADLIAEEIKEWVP
jgi:hypothetical protein